jgi:hypothetical protein
MLDGAFHEFRDKHKYQAPSCIASKRQMSAMALAILYPAATDVLVLHVARL